MVTVVAFGVKWFEYRPATPPPIAKENSFTCYRPIMCVHQKTLLFRLQVIVSRIVYIYIYNRLACVNVEAMQSDLEEF